MNAKIFPAASPAFVSGASDPGARRQTTIGVIVPPANAAVESELAQLLPAGTGTVVTRFSVSDDDLRERLSNYLDELPARVRDFGSLTLDALYVACTGCFYALGPTGVHQLEQELTANAGCPIITPVRAIRDALGVLGVDRMTLVSPYPDWLTAASVAFWEEAGVHVARVITIGDGHPYRVTATQLVETLADQVDEECNAVVFSGTGVPTLAAMEHLSGAMEAPMLSSNWCACWVLAENGVGRYNRATI